MRDIILPKHFHEPMMVLGKRIKIWKELPNEVIQQRKTFKQLTEKLIQGKIRFRWEISCGINFLFENKRWLIKTTEKMHEFLVTEMKGPVTPNNLGKQQENQNGS